MPNIIINNYCNQKCSYCFAEDSMTIEKKEDIVSQKLSTYIQILKFLKKFSYDEVRILGGEPLLHPEINKMMILANKGGFETLIFSNLNFPNNYVRNIFTTKPSFPKTININLNNSDFYTEKEYKRISENIEFFQSQGVKMIIGYNMYDFSKGFDDIASFAKINKIYEINLKITNSIFGKKNIIDTGSREYGVYIYSIISKYADTFTFQLSCGLSKDIFTDEELSSIKSKGITLKFGCDGYLGGFDIDLDGEIYHCFPLRKLYLNKNISIYSFKDKNIDFYKAVGIEKSNDICVANKYSPLK